ncbi:hypothetical protein VW29_16265 [Devosia limi DSM 17137]|uniref:Membrane protein involved in the export of O-antigen and teichoic acid n=1 Tax=Devosia limi DSM 17137 TaxID=1121477 RepID=A0A0F5LL76_9HYPH|nr:oligosaccharide flippase family protein [Devosia limi]KKB82372.1 hypothetical protein VW29_16265 [Devosia limi DSM 17137]SHE64095.1 Membrane protein involved in the export of O-antigen and teichoic acid [Devosia limi DSM 17137]
MSEAGIGAIATRGIFWSLVQNWGAKVFTFVLFVSLARILTPADYGLAAAAASVLLLIGLVAEFGFGDAIVQRRDLQPEDVNLPFIVSVGVAASLALGAALMAGHIEAWLRVPGLSPVIVVACALAPVSAMTVFQEMNYRRQLAFRQLAYRVLIANLVAGPVAILLAYRGAGVWSLIAQTYLSTLVGLVWLWARPRWRPSLRLNPVSFLELARFGGAVVSLRLADFAATRLVEIIIIGRFGIAVFGLYAVGSRLYQVLMQLLQSALNEVALTVLSRIASERERMGAIYIRAIMIAAYLAAPVFVLVAALAPEICGLLFGQDWAGVDAIARPLLLLGAVQSVQYLNGAYLSARGRPSVVLRVALVKYAGMIVGIVSIPTTGVVELVTLFVVLQLVATPLSFWAVGHELGLGWRRIAGTLAPSVLACMAGYGAVALLRMQTDMVVVLALGFAAIYGAVIAALGRSQVRAIADFFRSRLAEKWPAGLAQDGA